MFSYMLSQKILIELFYNTLHWTFLRKVSTSLVKLYLKNKEWVRKRREQYLYRLNLDKILEMYNNKFEKCRVWKREVVLKVSASEDLVWVMILLLWTYPSYGLRTSTTKLNLFLSTFQLCKKP